MLLTAIIPEPLELEKRKIEYQKEMSTGTFRVSLSWNTHSLLCHFSSLFLSTSLPTFLSDVLFEWPQSHTCNWNPLTIFMQWNHRFYIMVFNRLSFWVLTGLGMTIWYSSFFRTCRTKWGALNDLGTICTIQNTWKTPMEESYFYYSGRLQRRNTSSGLSKNRSNRPELFYNKNCVLKNVTKFTGKHLCWSLVLNKASGLLLLFLLK